MGRWTFSEPFDHIQSFRWSLIPKGSDPLALPPLPMVAHYYPLSPIILPSSASSYIKLSVVLQFLQLNNSSPKTCGEKRVCKGIIFIFIYLYATRPFSTLLPCFLYSKARNSCLTLLRCPTQLFHIHPVALSICWQVGKLMWREALLPWVASARDGPDPFVWPWNRTCAFLPALKDSCWGHFSRWEPFPKPLRSENWGAVSRMELDKACVLWNVSVAGPH